MEHTGKGIGYAVLAAALYALNAPLSKLLLEEMPPALMAGVLYVGAGLGMLLVAFVRKLRGDATTAANASLLNNFEIVATAVIALVLFGEKIPPRLWLGILFITASCAILSFEDRTSLQFSRGSLFVLLAAVCWGLENNCTRKLSAKDPLQIVALKGLFSGSGSLIVGACLGERLPSARSLLPVLALGFVAYGLSIYFYVYAQRLLGAARTSAYYAVAPFIAAILSLVLFRQVPDPAYFAALGLMLVGARLASPKEATEKESPRTGRS